MAYSGKKSPVVKYGPILIILLFLAFGFEFLDISFENIPTANVLENKKKQIFAKKQQLKNLLRQHKQEQNKRQALMEKAAPYWLIEEGQKPEAALQTHLSDIIRKAQSSMTQRSPKNRDVLSQEYVKELNVSVSHNSSTMKEASRFLEQLAKSDNPYMWKTFSLRPVNTNDPKTVRLRGDIKILYLTEDAVEILNGTSEKRRD